MLRGSPTRVMPARAGLNPENSGSWIRTSETRLMRPRTLTTRPSRNIRCVRHDPHRGSQGATTSRLSPRGQHAHPWDAATSGGSDPGRLSNRGPMRRSHRTCSGARWLGGVHVAKRPCSRVVGIGRAKGIQLSAHRSKAKQSENQNLPSHPHAPARNAASPRKNKNSTINATT